MLEGGSLPDIEKIRQLVDMMVANDLVELSVKDGDDEIKLRRPGHADPPTMIAPQFMAHPAAGVGPAAVGNPDASDDDAVDGEGAAVDFVEIGSPMVGTFYAASDPEAQPFVQVGSQVGPTTVVCVLEAMKVFSEIKAETAGTIERVLVKNGEAVEYGQPLFLVRPA
jgi:acetyl-CoA carboxylase biotin carboxyl carrier protein